MGLFMEFKKTKTYQNTTIPQGWSCTEQGGGQKKKQNTKFLPIFIGRIRNPEKKAEAFFKASKWHFEYLRRTMSKFK